MNLDGLNKEAINLDPDIAKMIDRMDEHEKYRTKELMFAVLPTLIEISASHPDVVDPEEIVEGALNFSVAAMTHASLAGL